MILVAGPPGLSLIDGILDTLGLITGIGGLICGPIEFSGHAPGGAVEA
ncbi:hypothetical protein ABII15_33875 [Streptomyces sp. HUAS MG91]|uniref:Uncharacterized protein n=1 Tax=Streptomyces tabacisoli TaxID=3156398 RepID=A0AAU8J2G7_9ACTN